MSTVSIFIDHLKIYAYHGVLPQEQQIGANFYVSVKALIEVSELAVVQDELQGTVSYADLCKTIRDEMARPARLLEHVAWRTSQTLLNKYPSIQEITLSIEKENPPMGQDIHAVGIEICTKR